VAQELHVLDATEAQRLQDIQMSEGQRTQAAETAGSQFMFQTREGREMQKMDRTAGLLSGAQAQQAQASADFMGAISSGVSAVGSIGGAVGAARAKT
jgi:hypothetical protein